MGKWLDENYNKVFKKYTKKELVDEIISFSNSGTSLNKIEEHFFKEVLFKAKRVGFEYTPMEYLSNDEMVAELKEYIKTKPNFYLEESGEVKNILMSLHNRGTYTWKVAKFQVSEARKIYQMLPIGANIYDYSCGWGNRMLACLISGYNYYGTDPNTELHKCLIDCSEFLKNQAGIVNNYDIRCTGSEIFHSDWENKMDMCFSSPPYFNLEIYTNEKTQSYNEFNNYGDWIKKYMVKTILNCNKYLKSGGLFIMNIKDTNGYNMYTDILNIIKALISKGILNWVEEKPLRISLGTKRNYSVNDKKLEINSDKEFAMRFKKL